MPMWTPSEAPSSSPRPSEKEAVPLFGPECYHRNDYGFFFNNLKQNIADRIKAFMENK